MNHNDFCRCRDCWQSRNQSEENKEVKKEIDFDVLYTQICEDFQNKDSELDELDFEVGSYELAKEVGKRVKVKNPDRFAETVCFLVGSLDEDFTEVLEDAYKITQIWEAK